MSEYTPTTDEIRTRGLEGADLNDLNSDEREALEEFDQWLAEVERAAAEKAWDEREAAFAADLLKPLGENLMRETTPNPYRREDA